MRAGQRSAARRSRHPSWGWCVLPGASAPRPSQSSSSRMVTPATVAAQARYMRSATDGEMAAQLLGLTYDIDVTDLLPKVRVPTLVLGRRNDHTHPFRLTRELAA